MRTFYQEATVRSIPSYGLYGDMSQDNRSGTFNFEWIPQRSAPYHWKIQPHTHESFIQLLYPTAGSGEILIDNTKWHARAPCLIVVPAQTVHGFHFSSDIDGAVITAGQRTLESIAAVAMPELVRVIRHPAVIALNRSTRYADTLMPLMLAIEREWKTNAIGQIMAGMSLIIALLVQISRISDTLQEPYSPGDSRKATQIDRFRAIVDAHFKEHISIGEYASQLGVTAGQLSRVCREVLGMSALDVVNARLVHEAKRNLVHTSLPIKQVAGDLGFQDEAYFGRFFRKHTGMRPKEFRIKALAEIRDA